MSSGLAASANSNLGGIDRQAHNAGGPGDVIPPLRAVVCGSFRRATDVLRRDFAVLHARYEVLSPISLDFVDPDAEFVRLPHELAESEAAVEQRHLDAIDHADFIWLHAPGGHLGVSAAVELSAARTMGIPAFATAAPVERAFADWVTVVSGPDAIDLTQDMRAPGQGLRGLQNYYERIARRRGWANESPRDTMLLMTEEMGELARAIRKETGLARDGDWDGQNLGEELADMQLYLLHLANGLGVDLADVVTAKELVNAQRVEARSRVA